ncbi:hypothetical protein BSLG_010425 [Batrachochytrium salamandrivorans]|nr:hypothetical protein BSLG_010425 [Batrachochytrium salamandrivorans]
MYSSTTFKAAMFVFLAVTASVVQGTLSLDHANGLSSTLEKRGPFPDDAPSKNPSGKRKTKTSGKSLASSTSPPTAGTTTTAKGAGGSTSPSPSPDDNPFGTTLGQGVAGDCMKKADCEDSLNCARLPNQSPTSKGVCITPDSSVVDLGASCGGFTRDSPQCGSGMTCKLGEVADGGGVCTLETSAVLSTDSSSSTGSAPSASEPSAPAPSGSAAPGSAPAPSGSAAPGSAPAPTSAAPSAPTSSPSNLAASNSSSHASNDYGGGSDRVLSAAESTSVASFMAAMFVAITFALV